MKWWIESAEARKVRFPDTFHIPSRQKRDSLEVGDYAKLFFIFSKNKKGCVGERMWVQVTQVAPNAYEGELRNTPTKIKGLKHGDKVIFLASDVADIRGKGFHDDDSLTLAN